MDDFGGNIPFKELLKLADFYAHQVEVKGGVRAFTSKAIIITSNNRPEEWYDNEKNEMGALYRRISQAMWLNVDERSSKHFVYDGVQNKYEAGRLY